MSAIPELQVTPAPRKWIRVVGISVGVLAILAVVTTIGVVVGEVSSGNVPVLGSLKKGFDKRFDVAMRENCVSTAMQGIKQRGLATPAIEQKVNAYCGCVTDEVRTKMTVEEFTVFTTNPNAALATPKMQGIITECKKKLGG